MSMQYARVRETLQLDEDTTQVTSTSYTSKLSSVRVETSQDIQTSQNELLKDLISCLEQLKETEDCLIIKISKKHGQPRLITKTWTVSKEYYGK